MYVTQPKNFSRIMKRSNWLTASMFTKLLDILQTVREKFGRNNVNRGHWDEIELIRHLISRGCIAEKGCSPKLPTLNMRRENSNYNLSTYPTFVLKYSCEKNKSKIIKLFSCGDLGIFSNDQPCIILLKDDHFYNVWRYETLFLDIDNLTICGKHKSGGASVQLYYFALGVWCHFLMFIYMFVNVGALGVCLRLMNMLMKNLKTRLCVLTVVDHFFNILALSFIRLGN